MRSRFIDFLTGYEKSEKTFESSHIAEAQVRFTDTVVGGSSSLATLLIKNPVSIFFVKYHAHGRCRIHARIRRSFPYLRYIYPLT